MTFCFWAGKNHNFSSLLSFVFLCKFSCVIRKRMVSTTNKESHSETSRFVLTTATALFAPVQFLAGAWPRSWACQPPPMVSQQPRAVLCWPKEFTAWTLRWMVIQPSLSSKWSMETQRHRGWGWTTETDPWYTMFNEKSDFFGEDICTFGSSSLPTSLAVVPLPCGFSESWGLWSHDEIAVKLTPAIRTYWNYIYVYILVVNSDTEVKVTWPVHEQRFL